MRLGPLTLPWRRNPHANDPYWEHFVNTPFHDLANSVPELLRNAPEGVVFPAKAELHTPAITSDHLKQLATYLGACMTGIARLEPQPVDEGGPYPYAVLCAVTADYDPRTAPGLGWQVPVQNALFVTFVLSAWMRELGYRATAVEDPDAVNLAVKAGMGRRTADGRLETAKYGTGVHIEKIIRTDLPLAADG